MGIIIRQSFKSTFISYIGIAIGMVNVLWLMLKFFSPEQVGLFRLLQDIPILIASFMQFGAAGIADKFFPNFKTGDGKHNGFAFFLVAYAFLGYLFFLLTYWMFHADLIDIYQNKSVLFTDYIAYLIPLSLFVMFSSIFESYGRVHLRIVVPTLIREIILRILFSLLIAGFALQFYDFGIAILLFVVSYGLALILLIIYTVSTLRFYFKPDLAFLDNTLIKNISSYVLVIVPISAASLITSKFDTLIIGAALGLTDVAIYNLAFFIGSIVDMPKRALSQISLPIISSAWNRNDFSEIAMIYKKSTINQAILGFMIFLMIWLNVDIILSLVPKHEIYAQGKIVILFVALSRLVDMSTGVNSEIIITSPFFRVNLYFVISMAIITLISNYIFVQYFGINGVAFSAMVSMVLFNICKIIFIWKKINMQPYDWSMVRLLLVVALIWGGFYFWPQATDNLLAALLTIAIRCIVIGIVFVSGVYYLKVSEDFNHTLLNFKSIIKTFMPEKKA